MKRLLASLISTTLISFLLLTSTTTSANDVTDTVSINVPASCSLTSTVDNTHGATVANGVYKEGIGTTTFSVFCNDNDGFGIYAIGYSGDTHGNNEMLSQNSSITRNIVTGTATSGNISNWAMKLTPVTGTITPTIDNGYDNYNVIPDVYTRVASFTSITNNLATSKFQSTYSVYAAGDQPAGTYIGKVKYTITHPASVDPSAGQANLDTGQNINKKLKSLASGTDVTNSYTDDTLITAFVRSDTLPANFTPSTANTISLSNSLTPVYVWFDSNDGTMYYYSKAKDIYMNGNSDDLFRYMKSLADISGLKYFIADNVTRMNNMFQNTQISDLTPITNWKVDNVTNMGYMFYQTQISDLTPLISWNVSNVTSMNTMLSSTQISDLTPITNWNVGNVTDMSSMFSSTQISNLTPLANWSVGNVTDMRYMFRYTQISDLIPLANWNVGKVTMMNGVFYNTQISDLAPIANWDVSNVTDMNSMFAYTKISDLTPITNWDIKSLTSMGMKKSHPGSGSGGGMFEHTQISDLTPIAHWDVSNVVYMGKLFDSTQISDLAPIANWDVSNVTDMSSMFAYTKISDLTPIASWNTSNVVYMDSTFAYTKISDISPISNWDVSKVFCFTSLFEKVGRIVNLDSIKNWDVREVGDNNYRGWRAGFSNMFDSINNSNLSPFTLRPGVWQFGTYIPNP